MDPKLRRWDLAWWVQREDSMEEEEEEEWCTYCHRFGAGEPVHPVPRGGEPIGPEPRPPGAEGEYLLVPSPSPPAEDEYLLVPSPPLWEDCLPLPLPPAEGKYLLVPSQAPWEDSLPLPPSPAEGEYLLVPSPSWEDCLPLPPPPAEGEYLLVPSPPPPAEGEYLLVPPPPSWEGLLLPCLAPPKDACHASPGAACGSASPGAACGSALPGEPPVTGYKGEVELPLPPPWPGAPLQSSPPEGPLLLPSPPEGPASPGVATSPAMRQEILWLEPHEGELPVTKKGGRSGDQLPPQRFRCKRTGGRSPTEGSCRP
ncbi:UNVERIFIED_CONTAM: hypothetical protein FKN15_067560 [Acipenser sinensis]